MLNAEIIEIIIYNTVIATTVPVIPDIAIPVAVPSVSADINILSFFIHEYFKSPVINPIDIIKTMKSAANHIIEAIILLK